MRRSTLFLLVIGFLALGVPPALAAQQAEGGNDVGALRALAAQPSPAQRDRASITDFLRRPEVAAVARDHGIDPEGLQDRVASLGAGDAHDLATHVRETETHMAQVGGDTFVITSTTIIIALLVIILIAET